MKPPVVIFDVDGVLANNDRRIRSLDREHPDWVAFHEDQESDPLRRAEAVLLRLLHASGHRIVLLTNRPESYRVQTETWLTTHELEYHQLIMRKNGDNYHEAKLKSVRTLVNEGWNIVLILDDDPQHCENLENEFDIPVLYIHSGYYEGERLDTTEYISQDPPALPEEANGVRSNCETPSRTQQP